MTDPSDDPSQLPDEQLDELFEQITDRRSNEPVDEQAQDARNVLDLIERVSSSERNDTAIPHETDTMAPTLIDHLTASMNSRN